VCCLRPSALLRRVLRIVRKRNMGMFLVIAVCLWVGFATVFVLALMFAASRRMPSPDPQAARPAAAAMDTQDSPLTPTLAENEKEVDPVLPQISASAR
jgi:hypothetical protein